MERKHKAFATFKQFRQASQYFQPSGMRSGSGNYEHAASDDVDVQAREMSDPLVDNLPHKHP